VFVRLNRNGQPLPKALHPNQVALIVKDLAHRAGYRKREINTIAAHSTRIGATHALAEAGTDVLQVQQDGGWKSPQMPATYLRGQRARSGGMAQWFRTLHPQRCKVVPLPRAGVTDRQEHFWDALLGLFAS